MSRFQRLNYALALGVFVFATIMERSPVRADDPASALPDSTLQDYLTGNGLLNRGLYELAADAYRKFLDDNPAHDKAPTARYGLGVALFRMDRFDDALDTLTPLLQQKDFEFAAEVGMLVGQCRVRAGHYSKAAEAFIGVATDHSDHDLADDAAVGATESFYRAGDYDNATKWGDTVASRWSASPLRSRADYFAGLAEFAQNHVAQAAQHFASVLERDGSGPFADHAGLLLAQCYERGGKTDRAVKQYGAVVAREGTDYAPDALLALGFLAVQRGDWDSAAEYLDRFLERYPQSELVATAYLLRGRVYFERGAFDQAGAVLDNALAPSETVSADVACEAVYWRAKCDLRLDHAAQAAGRLADALGRFTDCRLTAEMAYDLGIAHIKADKPDEAIAALSAFRKQFPEHTLAPEALYLLGITEHQRQRYAESDAFCRAYADAYPDSDRAVDVSFLTAENAFLSADFDAAVTRYEAFLHKYPDNAGALKATYRLGTALYRLGRFDQAEPYLAETAKHAADDSSFTTSLMATGDLHFQRGEWKLAERYLTDYLNGGATVAHADDAVLKLGLSQARQDRPREAIATFERITEGLPNSRHALQAQFETGQCFVSLSDFKNAKSVLSEVVRRDKENRFKAFALDHLAAIAARDGAFDDAATLYGQVAEVASEPALKATAMLNQGRSLAAARKFDAASEILRVFLSDYPNHPENDVARAHLAIVLARQDQCDRAVELATQVDQAAGVSLDAGLRQTLLYEKAWCLRESGHTDRAADAYRVLLDQQGTGDLDAHATLELAVIEANAKRYDEAATLLRKLRDASGGAIPPDVREPALYRLGICEFELENFKEAAEVLSVFLEAFPRSDLAASAGFYSGEAYFRLGKFEAAARELARVTTDHRDDPAYAAALLRLGETLAQVQRWSPSERAYMEYLDRFAHEPQWYQAAFGVGWARENQQRYEEAIKSYGDVVARHQGPTAARAQFQIGECLFAQKEYDAAARELLKVDILYAYPEWTAAALYEAGRCLTLMNKTAEARDQFQLVIENHGDTRWAQLAAQRIGELSASASVMGK